MRRVGVIMILGTGAVLTGCFRYVPVPEAAPALAPGTEVRVRLSSPRSVDVGQMTVNDIIMWDGTVYAVQGDTLSVWTQWLYGQYGRRHASNGSILAVSRANVRSLEARRIQPGRTVAATGIGLGSVFAIFMTATELGGGGVPGEEGGEEFRIAGTYPLCGICPQQP